MFGYVSLSAYYADYSVRESYPISYIIPDIVTRYLHPCTLTVLSGGCHA